MTDSSLTHSFLVTRRTEVNKIKLVKMMMTIIKKKATGSLQLTKPTKKCSRSKRRRRMTS